MEKKTDTNKAKGIKLKLISKNVLNINVLQTKKIHP